MRVLGAFGMGIMVLVLLGVGGLRFDLGGGKGRLGCWGRFEGVGGSGFVFGESLRGIIGRGRWDHGRSACMMDGERERERGGGGSKD
jgi:hypothetical protein